MKYLKWAAIVILSFGLGVLFVQYLSVHPLQMSLYLAGALVVLFGLILLLVYKFKD